MSGASDHVALLYRDAGEFVDRVGDYLRAGLYAGDHVMVIVTPEKHGWLREALGTQIGAMEYTEAGALYERHGPMFRTVLDHLEHHERPGSGRLRMVAEQALAKRNPVDVRAYMRYEAAMTVALGGFGASILCPYDAEHLADQVLDAALQTHPKVSTSSRTEPSERFVDPRAFIRANARAEDPPPGAPTRSLNEPADIAAARALTGAQAEALALSPDTVEDLVLAFSEVAANAFLHGDGPRQMWCYVRDGHLVCHVRDSGAGLSDPLVGYLAPDRERLGGRGLWLAHQLCDSVEITTDAAHTDVCLRVRLP